MNMIEDSKILLDVCCGICLLGVIPQIDITNAYFIFSGDNLSDQNEYEKRLDTFLKVSKIYNLKNIFYFKYNHDQYLDFIKGFEDEKERGYRCYLCFSYRFNKLLTASIELLSISPIAREFYSMARYFSTTLSISRYKDFQTIERAANDVCEKIVLKNPDTFNLKFFDKSFRNDRLYRQSYAIAIENNLYRQNFCGCEFSKKNR
ncbi:MAG: epoxyqueuosine reductase QueH [Spirochaetes bacterium]|nr:epoxyqueuosine reductase QueH [Spirochaetota bacterium]